MNHAAQAAFLGKHGPQGLGVVAVDAVQRHFHAQNFFHARQRRLLRVAEVIDDNRLKAGLIQLHHRVRANVARASRYQYFRSIHLVIS